jgi:hypothetical protein
MHLLFVRIARLKGCFALDKNNEEVVYTMCGQKKQERELRGPYLEAM